VTLEEEFASELVAQYRSEGWELLKPDEALSHLSFEPDLFLRRGDEHLVVEVKRVGFASARAVAALRKEVAEHPNWHFELKLIPPTRAVKAHRPMDDEIRGRIGVAQDLISHGLNSEAFILTWTAVEAALRDLVEGSDDARPEAPIDLLRRAYEQGTISDAEQRQLQRGLQVRNRLVHGFAVDEPQRSVEELMPLALGLVERVSAVPQRLG
jgi:uncharacterized protein YutE (UPF0331/DUF86 family)